MQTLQEYLWTQAVTPLLEHSSTCSPGEDELRAVALRSVHLQVQDRRIETPLISKCMFMLAGKNEARLQEVKQMLGSEFDIKDQGCRKQF